MNSLNLRSTLDAVNFQGWELFMDHPAVQLPCPLTAWVAGNEVIVKNVNANIPVSLSWFLLPFLAFLCFPASAQSIASLIHN